MRLSNDFWFNYPIFLPDSEQFNEGAGDAPLPLPIPETAHVAGAQRGPSFSGSEYREDYNR